MVHAACRRIACSDPEQGDKAGCPIRTAKRNGWLPALEHVASTGFFHGAGLKQASVIARKMVWNDAGAGFQVA
jgi:hypothetical protein